jgi:hypothetical protein
MLYYGDTAETRVAIAHDKYYEDPDDDIHQAVYTLPNQQRINIIWIPRPMRYHHIHIQAPRLLVQISSSKNNTEEVEP